MRAALASGLLYQFEDLQIVLIGLQVVPSHGDSMARGIGLAHRGYAAHVNRLHG